jgi:hypothetical protein
MAFTLTQNSWDWVIIKGQYPDMTRKVKYDRIRIRNTDSKDKSFEMANI